MLPDDELTEAQLAAKKRWPRAGRCVLCGPVKFASAHMRTGPGHAWTHFDHAGWDALAADLGHRALCQTHSRLRAVEVEEKEDMHNDIVAISDNCTSDYPLQKCFQLVMTNQTLAHAIMELQNVFFGTINVSRMQSGSKSKQHAITIRDAATTAMKQHVITLRASHFTWDQLYNAYNTSDKEMQASWRWWIAFFHRDLDMENYFKCHQDPSFKRLVDPGP